MRFVFSQLFYALLAVGFIPLSLMEPAVAARWLGYYLAISAP
jgi:hypothetical protein